jgi:hypothetical protein
MRPPRIRQASPQAGSLEAGANQPDSDGIARLGHDGQRRGRPEIKAPRAALRRRPRPAPIRRNAAAAAGSGRKKTVAFDGNVYPLLTLRMGIAFHQAMIDTCEEFEREFPASGEP